MQNPIVFYHGVDLDGHSSGAVVKLKHPGADLRPISYGEAFPFQDVIGRDVVFVDFSLQPISEMRKMADSVKSLAFIDHHVSAIDAWNNQKTQPKNVETRFDDKKAACELTWEHFFPDVMTPLSVYLLGRYDVWDHEADSRVLPFQYGMQQFDTDPRTNFAFWQTLLDPRDPFGMVERLVTDGRAVLRYVEVTDAADCRRMVFETRFEGLRAIVANMLRAGSHFFDAVYDPDKHDIMVSFGWANGKWNISLYSTKEEVNVAELARKHGGGGHRASSGYQCDVLPWK